MKGRFIRVAINEGRINERRKGAKGMIPRCKLGGINENEPLHLWWRF